MCEYYRSDKCICKFERLLNATVVVLTQVVAGWYYHFVVESLAKIVHLWHQAPHLIRSTKTLFHTGWVTEVSQSWARLMGIDTTMENSRLLEGCVWPVISVWPPSMQ